MAAVWGITGTHGITSPGGYSQEVSDEATVEVATIKNEIGRVAKAQAKPMQKRTVTLKAKGEAELHTVTSGVAISGLTVISSKISETNDDFPTIDITAIAYS